MKGKTVVKWGVGILAAFGLAVLLTFATVAMMVAANGGHFKVTHSEDTDGG